MPHMVIEATRHSIERRLLLLPIETDAAGKPVDILAPPAPIQRTIPTPTGLVRVSLIVRTVALQALVGSAQSTLMITFDEGSVELLSSGDAEGLLAGTITIPFALRFVATIVGAGRQVARLSADFSGTTVPPNIFDATSKARLAARFGAGPASAAEAAIAAALTAQFRSLGVQSTGLAVDLTPGMASERLLTVAELPGVVWVSSETLALSLVYAPEGFPTPFLPVPFLPPGPDSFGLRLRNDGFQRTVRNPAVRRIARDMLSERLIDGFVQKVYAERGGQGGITDADRDEGRKRLDAYLLTPQGQSDLANATPAPTGNGVIRKHIKNVPDPFSDFDVEIPELDLWLGQDRVEGRAVARGEVNGFGFTATLRFRARPTLVTEPTLAIEMHDLQIDEPDVDIDLPFWLEWGVGILVSVFAGPVFGALVGFLLSSVLASLAEAFFPSNLGSGLPTPDAQPLTGLPKEVTLSKLEIVPEFLALSGRWFVHISDPRPFVPQVSFTVHDDRSRVGIPRQGRAWFACLGSLGAVIDSNAQHGIAFDYVWIGWETRLQLDVEAVAVPLPLQRFPWTIAVGHRSMQQYHFPTIVTPEQPLAAGSLTFGANVWLPEPPLGGRVENRTYTIDVQQSGENGFSFYVPVEAGCIVIQLRSRVIDAAGTEWKLSALIDVANETVTLGEDFDAFTSECEGQRREWYFVDKTSPLDKVWNPPDYLSIAVQRAIRTEQPAIASGLAELIEEHGNSALEVILAPSMVRGGHS